MSHLQHCSYSTLSSVSLQMTCVFVWGSPCPLGNSSQVMCQGSDQQAGSSFVDSMGEMPWTPAGHGLTFIGYQVDWQLLFKKYSLIYTYIYVMLSYHTNAMTTHERFFSLIQDSSNSGNVHTGTVMYDLRWRWKKYIYVVVQNTRVTQNFYCSCYL